MRMIFFRSFVRSSVCLFVCFGGVVERWSYETFGEELTTLKLNDLDTLCDWYWTLNLKTCMQRLWGTLFKCFFYSKRKAEKGECGATTFWAFGPLLGSSFTLTTLWFDFLRLVAATKFCCGDTDFLKNSLVHTKRFVAATWYIRST